MTNYCECGIPWVSGNKCEKCNKTINPERLGLVENQKSTNLSNKSINEVRSPKSNKDLGKEAANRVRQYGTLFENIGSVLQIINTIASVILCLVILIAQPRPVYLVFLCLIAIGILWCISFLQTSLIRGLASYFQMRSFDYLQRSEKN